MLATGEDREFDTTCINNSTVYNTNSLCTGVCSSDIFTKDSQKGCNKLPTNMQPHIICTRFEFLTPKAQICEMTSVKDV